MCPRTTIYVSSYHYICPHPYCCICVLLQVGLAEALNKLGLTYCDIGVLMLLYVSSHCCMCVLILLYLCPHTALLVYGCYSLSVDLRLYMCPHIAVLLYMCPHVVMYVSSYCFTCIQMLPSLGGPLAGPGAPRGVSGGAKGDVCSRMHTALYLSS